MHTGGAVIKNMPPVPDMQKMWVRSLGQKDTLEKEMSTHFSILAKFEGQKAWWGPVQFSSVAQSCPTL